MTTIPLSAPLTVATEDGDFTLRALVLRLTYETRRRIRQIWANGRGVKPMALICAEVDLVASLPSGTASQLNLADLQAAFSAIHSMKRRQRQGEVPH